jgi:DNA-binding NarL/FixJ family response regulator
LPKKVAVQDPLPLFRLGLSQALHDAGFPLIEVTSPAAIPGDVGVLLLSIRSPADWAVLSRLRSRKLDLPVVVLLENPSPMNFRTALRLGAVSAAPRAIKPSSVVMLVRALLAGEALVPAAVALAVLDPIDPASRTGIGALVSDRELRWLRNLADGTPVADIACQEGYSIRSMYRILSRTYRKLEASNRTQALLRAAEEGLLI